jgi:CTP:molybdopterin cytidylyltransferase MocA
MTRLAAIILAAGLSTRMGRFKPLIDLDGASPLERCVGLFTGAGLAPEDIIVVTGHRGDETGAEAARLGAVPVHNADFASGMFSSVTAGVRALPRGIDAFFVLPVDIPCVRPRTVARLMEDHDACTGPDCAPILYPSFLGERGHPPLISASLAPSIMRHDGTGGLRALLERHPARDVAVIDAAILRDLDTPEDCAEARRALREHPNPEECRALWELWAVPQNVRAHCRAVADVARRLAERVNAAGGNAERIDVDLAWSAAMVHDIAKGRSCHAREGARILLDEGFESTAAIVADHPDLELAADAPLTAREVVFLADKLVQGDRRVRLAQRYEAKLARHGHVAEARAAIMDRLARALSVAARFRAVMGCEPEDV